MTGPGGARVGAGRPRGSKDREPRRLLLTTAERALVHAYRHEHAEVVLRARAGALLFLAQVVDDPAVATRDRVRAASAILSATSHLDIPGAITVDAESTEESETAVVLARLEALAAAESPSDGIAGSGQVGAV